MESNHPQNKLPITRFDRGDLQQPILFTNTETAIKQALEAGERLTVVDAFKRYNTLELKHFIYLLRKSGMAIHDKWMSNDRKRWKVYWLAK